MTYILTPRKSLIVISIDADSREKHTCFVSGAIDSASEGFRDAGFEDTGGLAKICDPGLVGADQLLNIPSASGEIASLVPVFAYDLNPSNSPTASSSDELCEGLEAIGPNFGGANNIPSPFVRIGKGESEGLLPFGSTSCFLSLWSI